jgi:hypothetical protein
MHRVVIIVNRNLKDVRTFCSIHSTNTSVYEKWFGGSGGILYNEELHDLQVT